jgi:2-haloacid dehalogenase
VQAENIEVLLFDVFGTLVDWRSSVIAELTEYGRVHGVGADWPALADAWRAAYVPAMDAVRRGDRAWATLDVLHRESLDRLLAEKAIDVPDAGRERLANVWHRLHPWPDTIAGMNALRQRFALASLSNGNLALQLDLARFAHLPFDALFASDMFGHYKPDPHTYLGALRLLDREPGRVMLVAAHNGDLQAAASHGLRTAFVARPLEYGPHQIRDLRAEPGIDIAASDLIELARRLTA